MTKSGDEKKRASLPKGIDNGPEDIITSDIQTNKHGCMEAMSGRVGPRIGESARDKGSKSGIFGALEWQRKSRKPMSIYSQSKVTCRKWPSDKPWRKQ